MTERILPGTALADPAEMERFVADSRARWSTSDNRVAGTLWWYSTSSVVFTSLLTRLAEIDLAADPALDRLRVHVGEDGRVVNVYPGGLLPDVSSLPGALRSALSPVLETLSAVSGVRLPPLWAITTDAIANALLRAWRELGSPAKGVEQASWLVASMGSPLPPARFVELEGKPLVRRVSCCLIDHAGFAPCASCPHQDPAVRESRMLEASRLL
ncbi:Fe-S oxidoreductase [Kutzneria kofuensis]|uniref:Ferric iron reductase protein FhuF n=1 Tax=Kutzneria kofuensis TaxID=103725 RepID=A0A7W9KED4_9PSEU|nr:Fe-S oxidoreductase [Kutzneria kofuensis]MBB5891001.1 ferric iron reductase protein FhuF [Kutzneria kofuensis]